MGITIRALVAAAITILLHALGINRHGIGASRAFANTVPDRAYWKTIHNTKLIDMATGSSMSA